MVSKDGTTFAVGSESTRRRSASRPTTTATTRSAHRQRRGRWFGVNHSNHQRGQVKPDPSIDSISATTIEGTEISVTASATDPGRLQRHARPTAIKCSRTAVPFAFDSGIGGPDHLHVHARRQRSVLDQAHRQRRRRRFGVNHSNHQRVQRQPGTVDRLDQLDPDRGNVDRSVFECHGSSGLERLIDLRLPGVQERRGHPVRQRFRRRSDDFRIHPERQRQLSGRPDSVRRGWRFSDSGQTISVDNAIQHHQLTRSARRGSKEHRSRSRPAHRSGGFERHIDLRLSDLQERQLVRGRKRRESDILQLHARRQRFI